MAFAAGIRCRQAQTGVMKILTERGFTLLEMMLVLAMVAALSSAGWHGWQRWQQRQRLDESAAQIRQLLLRLRSDANWHNAERLLWLKPGARWCFGGGPAVERCRPSSPWQMSAPWPEVRLRELSDGMGFYGKNNTAFPGHVLIASPAGERRIIVSARGRVRICAQSEERCR